jgi:hypothetical protein
MWTRAKYVAVMFLLNACSIASGGRGSSASEGIDLITTLREGEPVAIQKLVVGILSGEQPIEAEWLEHRLETPILFFVEPPFVAEGRLHLGVENSLDFALCLLEIKHNVSTVAVLAEMGLETCVGGEASCEACNSFTFPLDEAVRRSLVGYWQTRMGARIERPNDRQEGP